MANIDQTDFTGIIMLPSGTPEEVASIMEYVNEYEPQYLKHIFGTEMYFAFEAGKATEPYKTLLTGDANTFQWGGQYYKFDGIKRMIACFVYTHYLPSLSRSISSFGTVSNMVDNSTPTKPSPEIVRARNEGARLAEITQAYILYKSTDYPKFQGLKIYPFPEL